MARLRTRHSLIAGACLLVATGLGLLVYGGAVVPASAEGEAMTPAPAADPAFGEAVRRFLLEHPEVVVEALERYQAKQKAAEAEAQKLAVAVNLKQIFEDESSPVLGNPEGDVAIVEFFDYKCPYCRKVADDLRATIEADGGVKLILKEWPILGPQSVFAAHAALAAARQGKYEAFHFALMEMKVEMTQDSILALAESVGLERAQLLADMQHPEVEAALRRNFELADALKLGGTPAFVIGRELVPGAVDAETLKRLIEKARNPAG